MTPEETEIRNRFPHYSDWLVAVTVETVKQRQAARDRSKRIAELGMTTRSVSRSGEFGSDDRR